MRVAAAVQRVLNNEIKERASVRLDSELAATALRQREWLGGGQLAELVATEMVTPEVLTSQRGAPALLVALLLGAVVVGLGLLGWRYLHRRTRLQPRLSD
jgi:hypothetical protein